MIDAEGRPFWWPEADAALFDAIRADVDRTKVELVELDMHINDPAFADAMADRLLAMLAATLTRTAHTRSPAMPFIPRTEIVAPAPGPGRRRHADRRLRGRHRHLGQDGRGRRRRHDHHLQLGPLPDGRPRLAGRADGLRRRQRIVVEMAAEVLPVVQGHAGPGRRQRHRSVPPDAGVPQASSRRWASPASRTSRRSG